MRSVGLRPPWKQKMCVEWWCYWEPHAVAQVTCFLYFLKVGRFGLRKARKLRCRLADFGWVEKTNSSDQWAPPWPPSQLRELGQLLLRDLGRTVPERDFVQRDAFVAQAASRLLLQWPHLDLDPQHLIDSARYWLNQNPDPRYLWNSWLDSAGLNLNYYDLFNYGHPTRQTLPIHPPLLEDSPYVVQQPRQIPTGEDLRNGVVLLKTSSNAYRIPFLRALFPQAQWHWLVLTRNPAASLNGLMDAWLSPWFHSHHLGDLAELSIDGYSNLHGKGKSWWKFDLPPGWLERRREPLQNICAFQWTSAYKSIFRELGDSAEPILRVKFEDLLGPQCTASHRAGTGPWAEALGVRERRPAPSV